MKKLIIISTLIAMSLSLQGCGMMAYHDLCNQPGVDKSKLSVDCSMVP